MPRWNPRALKGSKSFQRAKRTYKRTGRLPRKATYVRSNYLKKTPKNGVLSYAGIGIAPAIFTKVEFARNIQLNILTGSAGIISVYQSSLYDPVTAVNGSGQPRYFDQYMALYLNYCVTGIAVKCTFANTGGQVAKVAAMFCTTSGADSNSFEDFTEAKDSLGGKYLATVAGGPVTATIQGYRSVSKVVGIKDVLNQPEYWGGVNSNPANMIFFKVAAFTQDGGLNVGSSYAVSCDLRMTFYCKFFNNTSPTDSFERPVVRIDETDVPVDP